MGWWSVVQKLLFTGSDLLLSGYLAAESLLVPSNSVCLLLSRKDLHLGDEMRHFVCSILRESIQKDAAETACTNLAVTIAESDDPEELSAIIGSFAPRQVWFASSGQISPEAQSGPLGRVVSALHGFSIDSFNVVSPACGKRPEASLLALLQSSRLPFRLFQVPLVAGEYLSSRKPTGHAFLLFLDELHQLQREIRERYSDYFEYQSLRCYAPNDPQVNLVHAQDLAKTLLATASAPGHYRIMGSENVSFAQLCEWTGLAYDLNLMSVEDHDELNAIDKLFAERTQTLSEFFVSGSKSAVSNDNGAISLGSRFVNEELATAELKKIRRGQSAAVEQKLARAASLFAELEPKRAPVSEGELTYFTSGSQGTPVVMINALGQGLRYWTRLMSELSQHRKIIIWEPRGTASAPRPFSLPDQVNDLEAILSREGIESCHLVAWCTGPKVAIEFYLRHPEAVASLALLNGAYKCAATPKTLISEYEDKLEGLFRALDDCPAMAPIVRKLLLQVGADSEIPSEMDGKELARRVLALKSRDLQTEVMKPFESEASTLNYARQVLDFYSCDIGPKAAQIKVPALLVGAEYDQITSAEFSRQLAATVPLARYVHLNGATHYCLYEQSDRVSELLQDFFNELENSGEEPLVRQAAYVGEFSK